jgi:hypothetical protein
MLPSVSIKRRLHGCLLEELRVLHNRQNSEVRLLAAERAACAEALARKAVPAKPHCRFGVKIRGASDVGASLIERDQVGLKRARLNSSQSALADTLYPRCESTNGRPKVPF